MAEKQERTAFDEAFATETVEIVVLTGEHTGGAARRGGRALWTCSAEVLAHVDEAGSAVLAEARLAWLAAAEQRGTPVHQLDPLTQYVVRVRRAITDPAGGSTYGAPMTDRPHQFALDEVLQRDVHIPALDERLGQWLRPVSIATALGDFELDRSLGWFSGRVRSGGVDVAASLAIDDGSIEGSETCRAALARLVELVGELPEADARWRAFAASKLTDLAGDWQQDDEDPTSVEPITTRAFTQRIRLDDLTIAADGSVTSYYDDGDLFWGHAIIVEVAMDGTPTDAHIAG